MNKNIITYSKGASLKDGNAYLSCGVVILICIWIGVLTTTEQYTALALTPILLYIIMYTLDINGVQIDLEGRLVRTYKMKLWGKVGDWIDLNQYETIELDYETFTIITGDHSEFDEDEISSIHGHFVVNLSNGDSDEKDCSNRRVKISGRR